MATGLGSGLASQEATAGALLIAQVINILVCVSFLFYSMFSRLNWGPNPTLGNIRTLHESGLLFSHPLVRLPPQREGTPASRTSNVIVLLGRTGSLLPVP